MMLKNKKGFLLRDFVIVGMLFGLIIALYIIQVASVSNNYSNSDMISEDFQNHYSHLQDNLDQLDTSYKAAKGVGGLNLIGAFNVAFNSVFTVIIMVWDGISIYSGMAGNVAQDYTFLDANTVSIFLSTIIAMITAYLIFVWLSSVSRGKI